MSFNFSGGGTEIRTLDPMIKSHLLYQLSYASIELFQAFGGNSATQKTKNQENFTFFIKNCGFGHQIVV